MKALRALSGLVPGARPLARSALFRVRHLGADRRVLPDFIIVGAQKAGTTSLFSYLRQHAAIRMSYVKEVHYFDHNHHRGERWYRSHFPFSKSLPTGTLVGEASPYYLVHPHAPRRIRELLPSTKLIALLRNPVERAISHYFHERSRGREPMGLRDALRAEEERNGAEWDRMLRDDGYISPTHHIYSYKQRGAYVDQLERYLEWFDRGQILIMQAERLFADPGTAVVQICAFLGIAPDSVPVDYSPRNEGVYEANRLDEDRAYLVSYFAPFNGRLFSLLGERWDWG